MNKISIDVQMLIGFFQLMEEDKYYVDLENRLLVNVDEYVIIQTRDNKTRLYLLLKNSSEIFITKGLDYFTIDITGNDKRFILDPTETHETKMSIDRVFWYLDKLMSM